MFKIITKESYEDMFALWRRVVVDEIINIILQLHSTTCKICV